MPNGQRSLPIGGVCSALLVALAIATAAVHARPAQPAPPTPAGFATLVEKLVPQFLSSDGPSAVSIAVVRNGEVLASGGWGLADRKAKTAATADTTYRIGSVTKQFTAAAILRLVERKRLALSDAIGTHLPDLPPGWRGVTIEQLLNHTSGIPDFTEIGGRWSRHWDEATPPASLLALVAKDSMTSAPGGNWQYSNTGYVALAMLIEKIYGSAYAEVIDVEFSRPLRLTRTRVCEDTAGANGQAIGYRRDGSSFDVAGYRHVSHWFGGGGLCSTVVDLAAWNRALHGGRVLTPDTLTMMTTPRGAAAARGYGFGVMSIIVSGHREISHSGQYSGFASFNAWYPDDSVSVTVLTNTAPMPTREILARNLALAALNAPLTISAPVEAQPNRATLKIYAGEYTIQVPGRQGLDLRIWIDRGTLRAQAARQRELTLHATGPHTFGTAVDPSIQFIFSVENGAVTALTFEQAGRKFETVKRK
jgi:CubicO group peptidase (beta-lactamase class C family)